MKKNNFSLLTFNFSLLLLFTTMISSCIDTQVLPADKTIEEDFWKSKSDVQIMIEGAFRQMVSNDVTTRLMLWGEMRSDELNRNETPTGTIPTALQEITAADIQTTNTFTDWASIYSVINYCNIVLEKSQQVVSIDPSYTMDDYLVDRSQMLALRALCHFYLVRTYRDIPMATTAFINSSQDLEIPQQAPGIVLQQCIDDLKEAVQNAIQPDGFSDWRKYGYINKDGINSILADIYLWRASMTHNNSDYQACVDACDAVIASKQQQYPKNPLETDASDYPLINGQEAFVTIFINGNSKESIFELQLDGTNNSNNTVCNYYYLFSKSAAHGYCYASPIFGKVAKNSDEVVYISSYDYRYWNNTFDVGNTQVDNFDVRKMVTQNTALVNPLGSVSAFKRTSEGRTYGTFKQNWIVYRLSDVMLMKAEALVAMASDGDIKLQQACNLVREVNSRSLAQKSDSIKFSNKTKDEMEVLVLQERQRELCYEGKRWWDLMRYNYRHIEGVDINTKLADYSKGDKDFAKNYSAMLTLMARKYDTGQRSAVIAKMRTEPYLYWPILQSELKVNANLAQNPVYKTNTDTEKNY